MFKKISSLFFVILLVSSCFVESPKEKISTLEESNNIEEKIEVNSDNYTDIDNNNISEDEFNNSGRAKAIESETDLWNFFQNDEVWFSLNYPLNAKLLLENEYNNDFYYKINIKNIWWTEEVPMSLTKEEQEKNIVLLADWKFWENPDFVYENSKKVVPIVNIFAQDYIVLSRFDVCDVTLERTLLFYYNNKEIKIISHAPENLLKELMPEYFSKDEMNCGKEVMWNIEKQNELYNSLVENKSSNDIQTWFNDFDKMIKTINFD